MTFAKRHAKKIMARVSRNQLRCSTLSSTQKRSFSPVSKPIFATKYVLESSWRDLSDLYSFAHLDSRLETTKNASSQSHPGEAPLRPQTLNKFSSRVSSEVGWFFHHFFYTYFRKGRCHNSEFSHFSVHLLHFTQQKPPRNATCSKNCPKNIKNF